MTKFYKLRPDGTAELIRDIPQEAMLACPHCVMDPDHYRDDNTCRCDDPTHLVMGEWGYQWNSLTNEWVEGLS